MATVQFIRNRDQYEPSIRRLLEAVGEEFVPPLTDSARSELSRAGQTGGRTDIDRYVERCLDRPMVGVTKDGTLKGLLSFEPLSDSDALGEYTPTNHVERFAVDPDFRGRGIGTEMYRVFINDLPADYQQPFASTETWETNDAHIAILEDFGFELVHRVPDDRGPGLDTVYYARSL